MLVQLRESARNHTHWQEYRRAIRPAVFALGEAREQRGIERRADWALNLDCEKMPCPKWSIKIYCRNHTNMVFSPISSKNPYNNNLQPHHNPTSSPFRPINSFHPSNIEPNRRHLTTPPHLFHHKTPQYQPTPHITSYTASGDTM